ncbi:glycosyltransferase [Bacteroides fragilis]|nr:glycosyltransferase [Bacteroides fragilis]MCY6324468.1 glycosyltransferase [Bacteroides fragilis]
MKISVIIPTYNPGGYLFECLESVFKQTLNASEYEVLIILMVIRIPMKITLRNSY